MTSRPMPHSVATFADEWGSPSSPLTQHETLRRYEFSLDFPNPAAAVSMAISRPWTVFDTSRSLSVKCKVARIRKQVEILEQCSSCGKRACSMVALARNLGLLGSRFLTGLTAVFFARLHHASAW